MAEQPDHLSWRRTLKRRLVVAAGVCLLWSVAIEARLVYLQVIEHDALVARARRQQSSIVPLPARRGDIFDRNGALLAYNIDVDSIYAVPVDVPNPERTVAALCRIIEKCTPDERELYVRRLSRRDENGRRALHAVLRRGITPAQAQHIEKLKLDERAAPEKDRLMGGIFLKTETRRRYPNLELAAHLLGYVGSENKGLAGIEERRDQLVGGEPGSVLIQVDASHRPFDRIEKSPKPGASLVLTIDSHIQHVLERELAAGVKQSGAEAGSAIVMDPLTGEILGAASYPTFNPNAYNDYPAEARINRAIQNVYEPGSTFKIVTAGAALEEKLATPSDLIHTSPGFIRFGSRVIDEAKGHNYGTLTFEDVIVKSSNIGAIKIGLKVGRERLSSYVLRFGFGSRTSRYNFNGESPGIVWRAEDLTDSAVASVSMGYQVSVTPLQMVAAVSAVANGGELLEPRVVREVIRDNVRTPFPRTVVRRVLSPSVAKELAAIMEGVVERGTAKVAQIDGFTIAGKTGTAAKAIPGGYSSSDYNVSFVGFVPSREPVFTILVVIDSPHKMSPYGGTVAAPVFQKIATELLRYRGVPASLNRPPPVVIASRDAVRQQPVSGSAEPAVLTVAGGTAESPAVFPNLIGMSARDAARTLVRLGRIPHVQGDGFVVNQKPAAGSPLDDAGAATLWLDRRSRLEASDRTTQSRGPGTAVVPRGRP